MTATAETPVLLSFIVPGDVMELGPNRPMHYYRRHKLTQDWKGRSWACWANNGRVQVAGKIRIKLTIRRGRICDPDNSLSACKALLDGLKDQPGRPGMMRSDSATHVEYAPVAFETGAKWREQPSVVVTVEAVEE